MPYPIIFSSDDMFEFDAGTVLNQDFPSSDEMAEEDKAALRRAD
jgi:hypothetical protein